MRLTLFMVGAIVLIVFGIIGAAQDSGTLFTVQWYIWFMASVLSYFVDLVTGGWAPWVVERQPPQ